MQIYTPTVIVDSFFDNPDQVRDYALAQSYKTDSKKNWPGKRTDNIETFSKKIHDSIAYKLTKYFDSNDLNTYLQFTSYFHIIDNELDVGYPHKDPTLMAGIVYLNPNINPDAGTVIFEESSVDNSISKSVEIKNKYNRLVMYDGQLLHAANNLKTSEPRLSLVFFVHELGSKKGTPLQRMRSVYA